MPPKKQSEASNKYKKFTQLEHVLARPDTYVGSIARDIDQHWVLDADKTKMIPKQITHIPGLYKIYDEILVNAIDQSTIDKTLDTISVNIEGDEISVFNNGTGIPIEMHDEYKVYIPELIFGNLLTSSNYDDTIERTTGGRNGFGAKLANIFSKSFTIEIVDAKSHQMYTQTWTNNMTVKTKPIIKKTNIKGGYAKFTFVPDYEKFGMKGMEDDTLAIFEKRAYDVCACTEKMKVYFNDKQLNIKSFEKYVDMYIGNKTETPRVYERNDNWEVVACMSENGYKQVSFVNGICTSNGGTHVEYITRSMVNKISELITQKHKNIVLRPQFIKDHLFVFVRSILINPSFSSQTKTECTSKPSTFGSKFEPSDEFYKKIAKLGIMDEAIALAKHKEMRELSKTDGKKKISIKGIPKLDDANKAGTASSEKCTLILTEGDSAKTFAISGLSIVGRDFWGVFPLKGKMLNVRDASPKQLLENVEINALKQILGLQQNKVYKSVSELRYGKIMILTDADVDGSHIKGLIINFIHHFWPSLLELDPSFICSMITPIVKASKGNKSEKFYNLTEFDNWKKKNANGKGWTIKYYKGLGTSTGSEAKEYFKELAKNTVRYVPNDEDEGNNNASIELAFKKENADKRKTWILDGIENGQCIDNDVKNISYNQFINKDLIWFSIADLQRSIPCMVDGFKPSQRKVLYACRKRSSNKELKVSQLAGYISTETSYHHGEQSLMGAIITMAQNYVGSNTMNLLTPSGQFGTRLMGGKDAASPRYIYTNLSNHGIELFNRNDDPLLDYLDDDGFKIEPKYFVPTLPVVLINGAEGIGTGYSSNVPCYNPKDIKKQILRILEGKEPEMIHPWYRGFEGTIEQNDIEQSYVMKGVYKVVGRTTVEITELPVGKWTQDYKEFLESVSEGVATKTPLVTSYENHSTENKVKFIVRFDDKVLQKMVKNGTFEKELKLTSNISTRNMHLFDANYNIKKYHNVIEIMKDYVDVRKVFYDKRKAHMLKTMQSEFSVLDQKIRFIQMIVNNELVVFKRKKQEIIDDLKRLEFPMIDKTYDYLMGIKLYLLTEESIDDFEKKKENIVALIKDLESKTVSDLWKKDLENY